MWVTLRLEDLTYTYQNNSQGELDTTHDELAHTSQSVQYDGDGNVLSSTDGDGTATSYVYNALGEVSKETDPGGGTIVSTYNGLGEVLSEAANNAQGVVSTTSFTYDADGNQLTEINPNNAASHTAIVTDTYYLDGLLHTSADSLNDTTTYVYDYDGDVLSVRDPIGNTTHYAYDADDNLTGVTDPVGNATVYAYDADGNQSSVKDPIGNTTYYTYDLDGDQATIKDRMGQTTVDAYDADDRLSSQTDPMSNVTSYTYDAAGEETSVKDPLGHTTVYAYSDGEQTSETDPDGNKTTYTYDGDGNVLTQSETVATGRTQVNGVWQTNTTTATTTDTYLDGNLKTATDPDGNLITYSYDGFGQETGETWQTAAGVAGNQIYNTVAYHYDLDGDLLSEADNFSKYTYTYDSLDRLSTVSNYGAPGSVATVVLTNGYDADSDRNTMSATINGAHDFQDTFTFDGDNRETFATQQGYAGGYGDMVAYKQGYFTYNQDSQMGSFSDYGGPSWSNFSLYGGSYAYNKDGSMTGLSESGYDGYGGAYAALENFTWAYDVDQRVSSVANSVHPSEGTNYLYDADSQSDGTTSYGGGGDQTEGTNYDANGNPTGTGVVIGAGNRLLSDGTYNYAYDANGNLVSQTNIATGAATSFAFDPMNRLIGVVATNASHQITLSVAYSYDLRGDLLSRTAKSYTNGSLTTSNTSDFVFDPVSGNVVLAFSGSGALTDRYLYGPAVDELLADERVYSLSSAGTNMWTAIDNQGSVRDVWEDGVGLVDHIVYNSFGAITSQTNSYYAPLIGYTGSFTDPDTGLQWHNDPTGNQIGRWYDPKTQQWIGPDPDGLAPDSNPYRYVGNSPTNGTDPSGLAKLFNIWSWGISSPNQTWGEFFNPFDSGVVDSSFAFWGGAGRGAVNDVVGVGQAAQQTALQATDTVRVLTGTDHGKFLSQTGQAIQSGQLSAGQYYKDTAISTVTVGISNQIEAVAEYREGKISYEEMNKRIGTTALFQAGGAYGLSKTTVGNLPIQRVPMYLVRSLSRLRIGAASGPNFHAVAQNGLDLGDPALAASMANTGPVVFNLPLAGATAEEVLQMRENVSVANDALADGALSPTGRVSTRGALRIAASELADRERARAAAAGNPYGSLQAGHVPDTTWTGNPRPYAWQALTESVNKSLGSQATRYPLGYKPTGFHLGDE